MLLNMGYPKFLNNYFKVENCELPARFKITGRIPVEFDPDASIEELWDIHDSEMETCRTIINDVYSYGSYSGMTQTELSLLDLKVAIADKMLENCHFCERRCGVNRKKGILGYCRVGELSRYASEIMHRGEEPELVPSHTIFLSGCVFSCVYCQNWDISTHPTNGTMIDPGNVAEIIDMRRAQGAINVNFVTPTPHTHTILKIINEISVNTPVIWNSNMYHSSEVGKLLEGVVDLYLADFRYGNDRCAEAYSNVKDYLRVVQRNFETAYRQADIILRQLVLPGHLECCTRPIVEWTATHIPKLRFNLMFQYTPHYRAGEYMEINRYLTLNERERAVQIVREAGLEDVLV